MKIENEIISSVIAAVKELYGQDVPEKKKAFSLHDVGMNSC